MFNEAESSSRNTTARAFAFPGFDKRDLSRLPQGRLHGLRPTTMMNTLHFIRTIRLRLAHQEKTEETEESKAFRRNLNRRGKKRYRRGGCEKQKFPPRMDSDGHRFMREKKSQGGNGRTTTIS